MKMELSDLTKQLRGLGMRWLGFPEKWLTVAASMLVVSATLPIQADAQALGSYRLESATTLSSSNTSWDYVEFDQARGYLFIARRLDGLTVFNTKTKRIVADIENSKGANGILLLPAFNRILVANTDGTVSVIDYQSLRFLDRVKIDEGGINAGFFEPTTRQVFMVTSLREKTSTIIAVEPKTGKSLARYNFDATKLDTPAVDGKGHMYVPIRYANQIAKISAKDMKVVATWPTGPCVNPVALEFDRSANRLLAGCRGEKPVFVAMDVDTGAVMATVPIGRGIDGMVHDQENKLIVTSNGTDANLVVIRQSGPDQYAAAETIATRPMARTMAIDAESKQLFLVTADHSIPAGNVDGKPKPTIYHKDTFAILTYRQTE